MSWSFKSPVARAILELRNEMADLRQAITDLTGAVDGVAQRLGGDSGQVAALQAALDDAMAQVNALQANDDADKQALADAVSAAQAAADEIEAQVAELNTIGQDATPATDGGTTDVGTDTTGGDAGTDLPEEPATPADQINVGDAGTAGETA